MIIHKAYSHSRPDSELTLEEQTPKALVNGAKHRLENKPVPNSKISVLPIKEATITTHGIEKHWKIMTALQ